jgi:hypothetical protein
MTLKWPFTGVFANVTSKMFASSETQRTGRKIGTKESLSLFLLRRWSVFFIVVFIVGLVAVGLVVRHRGLVARRCRGWRPPM